MSALKTDRAALGSHRAHHCACGCYPTNAKVLDALMCPACIVRQHLANLRQAGLADPTSLLFPN
eukprot:13474508-Heterocapsa_arctica.AAC.1